LTYKEYLYRRRTECLKSYPFCIKSNFNENGRLGSEFKWLF